MDRGAWWATVHGVIKSRTQLSMQILSSEFLSVLVGVGRKNTLVESLSLSLSLSLSKNLFPKDMTQLLDGGEFRGCCSPSHHSWPTSSPKLWFPLGSRTFFQALGVDSCLLCWSPVSPGLVLPTVSWPMPLEMISVLRSLS